MAPRASLRSAPPPSPAGTSPSGWWRAPGSRSRATSSASGAEAAETGIGDDGVDAPERAARHRDQPLDVRLVADIALHGDAAGLGRQPRSAPRRRCRRSTTRQPLRRQPAGNAARRCRVAAPVTITPRALAVFRSWPTDQKSGPRDETRMAWVKGLCPRAASAALPLREMGKEGALATHGLDSPTPNPSPQGERTESRRPWRPPRSS